DVVAGGALALLDGFHRERGSLRAGLGRIGRDRALRRPGLRCGQLDPEPALHSALGRPYRAHLRARVALDHELIMRAASSPAFLAPSIATQPTGTPGGICTAERRASSPPRLLPVSGTPITGRSVCAAATPRT